MQKLYCYVDETGQHTFGAFFLVSAVILGSERDQANEILEAIETRTGKGKVKWTQAQDTAKIAYLEEVLAKPIFHNRIHFAVYENSKEYLDLVARTIQLAVEKHAQENYKVTIVVDGLEGAQIQRLSKKIRQSGIRYKKVIGARDETNALIRLADAICGFTRAALNHDQQFEAMLKIAREKNVIHEL